MKKFNYILLGAAGLLLASCSQDDLVNPGANEDGNTHITVTLPSDLGTRSFGNGLTAKTLNFALYDADNTASTPVTPLFESTADFGTSLSTTVNLNLVTGKKYTILFFAQSAASMNTAEEGQASNAVYTFDAANQTMTVDYTKMTSANNNSDAYDCFYNNMTFTAGATDLSCTLTRPVAQINWGTSDLDEDAATHEDAFGANGQYMQATLQAKAYNVLNLATGEVSSNNEGTTSTDPISVTLTNFTPPTNETFPTIPNAEQTYTYVNMSYLLVPSTESVIDELSLTINNGLNPNVASGAEQLENIVDVTSAPVQANYRTNIYGALLTSNNVFNVVKNANWKTPDYEIEEGKWDGTSSTTPVINTSTRTIDVYSPSDLKGLADLMNGSLLSATTYSNYTINLNADFDMGGYEFPMIGTVSRLGTANLGKSFTFTLDGNNHIISNLKITGNNTAGSAGAFIGCLSGNGSLKNLIFDNLVIDAPKNEQAGVVGMIINGGTVENVTVRSGSITAAQGAGAIVGRIQANGSVNQCVNYADVNITQYNGGGIVGGTFYTTGNGTMSISNCQNYGNITGANNAIGGIVGHSCADVSECTNEGIVKGGTASTGGIVGEQKSAGSVKNCVNNGQVIGGNNYGSGGIVGWVRYQNDSSYPRTNIISVTGCTNTAAISGNQGVGGIVGIWYMCGVCSENINTAPSLTSSSIFVAGIVGGSQWTETAPSNPTGGGNVNMLYVTNNVSTTTLDEMTGGSKALYVYINSPGNTEDSGNTQTLPSTEP